MKMLRRKNRFMHFCFFWHENELWSNLIETQHLVNGFFFELPFPFYLGLTTCQPLRLELGQMGWGLFVGSLMPPAGSDGCTLRVGAPWKGGGAKGVRLWVWRQGLLDDGGLMRLWLAPKRTDEHRDACIYIDMYISTLMMDFKHFKCCKFFNI